LILKFNAFFQQMTAIFVFYQQHNQKMKKGLFITAVCCITMASCFSMKNKTAAQTAQTAALAGSWQLDVIPHPNATLDSLYHDQKPSLSFDPVKKTFSGYTGCNTINGPLVADSNVISFKGDITMTLKACTGDGESVFMENLKRINKFSISRNGKELTLIQGDIALMHFVKNQKTEKP
jgi:heat shock protein HslJ